MSAPKIPPSFAGRGHRGAENDKLHQWMKSFNPPIELPMMGLLNNYDGVEWRINEMAQMLANSEARQRLVRDVVEYAVESHESGIVVDFEEVPDASQAHFRALIGALAPAIHSKGLKLMIALPARDDAYDYEFFGKQCDAIVLMNTTSTGRIPRRARSPRRTGSWRTCGKCARSSRRKNYCRIANYAYDWAAAPKKGYEPAEEFSIQEALLHVEESESDVDFDGDSLNPHYSYYDERNRVHQVWLLDAVTAYNELRASERLGVQGTALWRLGSADTSLWPVWDAAHATTRLVRNLLTCPRARSHPRRCRRHLAHHGYAKARQALVSI